MYLILIIKLLFIFVRMALLYAMAIVQPVKLIII